MRGIIDGRTASGERPTHDSWFSPHSGHQRLDRPTWKYSARTSERALPSVRVTESARLRYQENRCSTLHVVRRVTTTCTRLETSNETSHGVAENMHLTHCTQSPPSRLCERVLGSLTIDLFNLLISSSSYDRCYSTPSSEAQRVIKMYGETYSKWSIPTQTSSSKYILSSPARLFAYFFYAKADYRYDDVLNK